MAPGPGKLRRSDLRRDAHAARLCMSHRPLPTSPPTCCTRSAQVSAGSCRPCRCGAAEPAARIVREQCLVLGGRAAGKGARHRRSARVTDAALVNGIACHALDFDDTHVPTILHPTTPLYAAGTPLAEWRGATVSICSRPMRWVMNSPPRASNALYPEHYDAGWHMARHHRRTRVGDRRDQAARPDRNRGHPLPEHRGDAGGGPPRSRSAR